MMSPILEALSKERSDISFCKVDVSKETELVYMYGVRAVPTILFLEDGKVVDQRVGTLTKKQIEDLIPE